MTEALLTARGLRVVYPDGATGVHNVSLEVRGGQTVALLGPNGAGKTTTLRALSGFLASEGSKITSGRVTFAGEDITNLEPHRAARRGLVCVPERRKIFPNLSVSDNLAALGHKVAARRRAELLDRVCHIFPLLAERRKEAAGRLSGGQQQMLAIARGLMNEARLLLLDEMTLGLHMSVRPVLYDAVRAINQTGTAVLISDEGADFAISLSDHCYIIRDGLIAACGAPGQFAAQELALGYLG